MTDQILHNTHKDKRKMETSSLNWFSKKAQSFWTPRGSLTFSTLVKIITKQTSSAVKPLLMMIMTMVTNINDKHFSVFDYLFLVTNHW